jgi:hypothetical protein
MLLSSDEFESKIFGKSRPIPPILFMFFLDVAE